MFKLRGTVHFVSKYDIKLAAADLERIYTSVTLEEAVENLLQFTEKRRKQYPSSVKSWEDHWDVLTTFYF